MSLFFLICINWHKFAYLSKAQLLSKCPCAVLNTKKFEKAFSYMFETGLPIPLKIVLKLLNALRGYRLSFYSLIDLKLSIL